MDMFMYLWCFTLVCQSISPRNMGIQADEFDKLYIYQKKFAVYRMVSF